MAEPLPAALSALYDRLRRALAGGGIEDPELEARLLIRARTKLDWADIIARPGHEVEFSALAAIESDLARRLAGEPLSRIHGVRGFWGLEFRLSPETLDPRADTETLVAAALAGIEPGAAPLILDLGTGTGCILISLLHECPGAFGIGLDQSFGALRTARENARINGVSSRAAFSCGNWLDGVGGGGFDLIVSNPPYIPSREVESLAPEVRNHDPILALSGGDDGLAAYRSIITETRKHLKPRGRILLEVGAGQASDVARLVEDSGLFVSCVHPDLAGIPRVIEAGHGDK